MYLDRFRLTPATRGSWQSTWIPLACLFIEVDTMPADVNGLATVPLLGRHELDSALALLNCTNPRMPLPTGMPLPGCRMAALGNRAGILL